MLRSTRETFKGGRKEVTSVYLKRLSQRNLPVTLEKGPRTGTRCLMKKGEERDLLRHNPPRGTSFLGRLDLQLFKYSDIITLRSSTVLRRGRSLLSYKHDFRRQSLLLSLLLIVNKS